MLSKMHLSVQIGTKYGQLKNNSEISSAPGDAQKSANRTTINMFDVRSMVKFRAYLIIDLEVHFKIYIKVQKKMHSRLH